MQIDLWLKRFCLALLISSVFMVVMVWATAHSDAGCDGCHVPHNAQMLPGMPL